MTSEWYCFKCKEKMGEAEINLDYFEIVQSIAGIACPKCGTAYLLEQTVVEEVVKGEEAIEAKI